MQPRHLDPLVVRNVGVGAQHVGQARRGLGVVVLVRAGQGDDQAARDVVRDPVHVVDLVASRSLPMFENTGSGMTTADGSSRVA